MPTDRFEFVTHGVDDAGATFRIESAVSPAPADLAAAHRVADALLARNAYATYVQVLLNGQRTATVWPSAVVPMTVDAAVTLDQTAGASHVYDAHCHRHPDCHFRSGPQPLATAYQLWRTHPCPMPAAEEDHHP